ncbi:STAS domain-containing protein [Halobacillus sp. BBL2006]|uniref:STAS domain-containing protein n=1 Tax=Halobacillus sp. BBL2006 TaxID=1543706 RepID=UPI000543E76E|nr:STAS domain-containing protein [Halobacillus sp. BBL2006]KHE72222.1 hypothetical protein LD39_05695 [Halobacillus sp. BBL2006]
MIEALEHHNREVTMKLAGDIHVEEATQMREKLLSSYEEGFIDFDIDFSRVSFIDSAGLGVLVTIHKRVLQQQGQLIIRGAKDSILEIFTITRLTRVFKFYD